MLSAAPGLAAWARCGEEHHSADLDLDISNDGSLEGLGFASQSSVQCMQMNNATSTIPSPEPLHHSEAEEYREYFPMNGLPIRHHSLLNDSNSDGHQGPRKGLERPLPLTRRNRVSSAPIQPIHTANNPRLTTMTTSSRAFIQSPQRGGDNTPIHQNRDHNRDHHAYPSHNFLDDDHHHNLNEAYPLNNANNNKTQHAVFDSIQEHYEQQLEFVPSGTESHDNDGQSIVSGLTADEASYTQSVRSAPAFSSSLPEPHPLQQQQQGPSHKGKTYNAHQPLNEYFDEVGPGLEDNFWVGSAGSGSNHNRLSRPKHHRTTSHINPTKQSHQQQQQQLKQHQPHQRSASQPFYTTSIDPNVHTEHDLHATHAQLQQRLGNNEKPSILKTRSSSNTIHSNAPSTASMTSYSSAQAWSGQSGSGPNSSGAGGLIVDGVLPPSHHHHGRHLPTSTTNQYGMINTNGAKRLARPKAVRRHHSMGSYASQNLSVELFPPSNKQKHHHLPHSAYSQQQGLQGMMMQGGVGATTTGATGGGVTGGVQTPLPDELVAGRERRQPTHKIQTSIYDYTNGGDQLLLSSNLNNLHLSPSLLAAVNSGTTDSTDDGDDGDLQSNSVLTPNGGGDASSRTTPTGMGLAGCSSGNDSISGNSGSKASSSRCQSRGSNNNNHNNHNSNSKRNRKAGNAVKQELKYVMGKMIPSPLKNISKLASSSMRRKNKTELERNGNGTLT